ncbi:MAG: hypothetical protein PUG50_04305 [Eubacteriales bacterium]|uniref:hypothetical protein n=1 Tax=Fenollaria sp. TaxID=1965292 RepID=UPI002A7489EA|nr:hypothetical protein [Fenollaria sp.]MDD7339780.1 hypothetical protein [Eubacteriales bacterium]MDY3106324.1 hypothetical protein [Fenollaria sp.]
MINTNSIKEKLMYEVKFCYGDELYHSELMEGCDLIAMLRFVQSYNAKYYGINDRLFNLDNYYNISWNER